VYIAKRQQEHKEKCFKNPQNTWPHASHGRSVSPKINQSQLSN